MEILQVDIQNPSTRQLTHLTCEISESKMVKCSNSQWFRELWSSFWHPCKLHCFLHFVLCLRPRSKSKCTLSPHLLTAYPRLKHTIYHSVGLHCVLFLWRNISHGFTWTHLQVPEMVYTVHLWAKDNDPDLLMPQIQFMNRFPTYGNCIMSPKPTIFLLWKSWRNYDLLQKTPIDQDLKHHQALMMNLLTKSEEPAIYPRNRSLAWMTPRGSYRKYSSKSCKECTYTDARNLEKCLLHTINWKCKCKLLAV
jgi:hypothetical protein